MREKFKVEIPLRIRVPMKDKGAEQPVVVMKPAKADGTKGLCYLL